MVDSHKRDIRVYIKRLLEHISQIKEYTRGINYDNFVNNKMLVDACITQLIQVGERAVQIKHHHSNSKLSIEQEIIDMRNFLVHSYIKIDIDIIREVIQENIPELEKKLLNYKL